MLVRDACARREEIEIRLAKTSYAISSSDVIPVNLPESGWTQARKALESQIMTTIYNTSGTGGDLWNGCSTTTGTASITDNVWTNWATYPSTASDTTTVNEYTWNRWIDYNSYSRANPWLAAPDRRVVTPAEARRERDQYERAQADLQIQQRRTKRNRRKAKQAARKLLWSLLDPEQRAMLKKDNRFRVTAQSGRLYEIDVSKKQHNLFVLDAEGKRIEELCVYATTGIPHEDNALAQMLYLVGDEDALRGTANRWTLHSQGSRRAA